jgi:hypothetical protein
VLEHDAVDVEDQMLLLLRRRAEPEKLRLVGCALPLSVAARHILRLRAAERDVALRLPAVHHHRRRRRSGGNTHARRRQLLVPVRLLALPPRRDGVPADAVVRSQRPRRRRRVTA